MYLTVLKVSIWVAFTNELEFTLKPLDPTIKTADDFYESVKAKFMSLESSEQYNRSSMNEQDGICSAIFYSIRPKSLEKDGMGIDFDLIINPTNAVHSSNAYVNLQEEIIESAIDFVLGEYGISSANIMRKVHWRGIEQLKEYPMLGLDRCENLTGGYSEYLQIVATGNSLDVINNAKFEEQKGSTYLTQYKDCEWFESLSYHTMNFLNKLSRIKRRKSLNVYGVTVRLPRSIPRRYLKAVASILYRKNALIDPVIYIMKASKINGMNHLTPDVMAPLQGHMVVIDIAPLTGSSYCSQDEYSVIVGNQILSLIQMNPAVFFVILDSLDDITPKSNIEMVHPNSDTTGYKVLLSTIYGNLTTWKNVNGDEYQHIDDIERYIGYLTKMIGAPHLQKPMTTRIRGIMKSENRQFISSNELCQYVKLISSLNEHEDIGSSPTTMKMANNIFPKSIEVVDDYGKVVQPQISLENASKLEPNTSAQLSLPDQELDGLIGLADVKTIIKKMIAYCQFTAKYQMSSSMSNHMVFTGNPGTAKTTVARLMYEILVNVERLKPNKFVEVGRQDLVGQYVGQTAPKVKRAFEKAIGGMLFIDEAYSLSIKNAGGFGEEAVATLVQEMENHRNDVIVVLAGYKNEMEEMLQINPGLRSRVSFSINFPDYSPNELAEITSSIVRRDGYSMQDDAFEYIQTKYNECKLPVDLGNGRYARNLVEHAMLNYSMRIINSSNPNDTPDMKLSKDDFEVAWNEIYKLKKTHSVGF